MQELILTIKLVAMISCEFDRGHGASGVERSEGPWPSVRMSHVTFLLKLRRSCTASKADLEPPSTRTCLVSGEDRSGVLAARE